jgi:Zn-dependent protease
MSSNRIQTFFLIYPVVLVSLSIHEFAHAWVAYIFGDDTAKRMGRLTLNPLAHISVFGTIILPLLIGLGFARPVPVSFAVLNKRQIFGVAIAGPASNILLALVLAGAFHVFRLHLIPVVGNYVLLAIFINFVLAVFNLLPIPPLDGSRMVYASLKSTAAAEAYNNISRYLLLILIGLFLLGALQVILLPVIGELFSLLNLPPPIL